MKLKKLGVPALAIFLGVMGGATPLKFTPAGMALVFTGIVGLLTFWSSRGDVGDKIRKHAFKTSLWISGAMLAFCLATLNMSDNVDKGMLMAFQTASYVVLLITIVLAIRYALFAYRHREPVKRSPVKSFVSFVSSFMAVTIWIVIGLGATLFAPQVLLTKLSPPVTMMLSDLNKAGIDALIENEDMRFVRGTQTGPHMWSCPAPTQISRDGAAFELNAADRFVLENMCLPSTDPDVNGD